jgi:short-subunit dehydrogenase
VEIAGSTIVVTGASSGIGAALAPELARRGATVAIVARRADRLAEVLEQCQEHAPASRMWAADLGDPGAAEALALEMWDELGGIDALVNNAAIPKRRSVVDLTVEEVQETMATNFESPVRMTLALLPRWLERDRGMVVNVSSFGGRAGILGEAAYCASKFALAGWSESMLMDLWDTGVEVRLVLPGAIDTEIWDLPGNDDPLFVGELLPAADMAAGIADCIEGDRFELYLPDMKPIVEMKTSDAQNFLGGVVDFARSQREARG